MDLLLIIYYYLSLPDKIIESILFISRSIFWPDFEDIKTIWSMSGWIFSSFNLTSISDGFTKSVLFNTNINLLFGTSNLDRISKELFSFSYVPKFYGLNLISIKLVDKNSFLYKILYIFWLKVLVQIQNKLGLCFRKGNQKCRKNS